MSRGSDYSYLHMREPHHIVYMQEWTKDSLPNDDIEINERYFHEYTLNDTLDGAHIGASSSLPATLGGSSLGRSMQKKRKDLIWKDLDVKKFLYENRSGGTRNARNRANGTSDTPVSGDESDGEVHGGHNVAESKAYTRDFAEFGGIRVVDHDHTILETVQERNRLVSTLFENSVGSAQVFDGSTLFVDSTVLNTP